MLPAGDRRCRQNGIDAIAGVNPPLLALLEVEPVAEAIEIQRQEPIEPSKFGRIIYPKPIALAIETLNGVENCSEADRPPNRGDNGRGRIESESELSQSAMAFRPASYGCDDSPAVTGITFSPKFIATYPPYFGEIHYKAETNGQLNLLEPDIEDEPPDPDDFDSIDAFREAMARWDAEHPPEPLEVSMASMCEWAPCPLEWYEPETIETIETVSCTLEISPVSVASSSTCNFSIPVFGGFAVACGAERHRPPRQR